MRMTPDSQEAQCHDRVLIRRKGGSEAERQEVLSCWLEDGGRGHEPGMQRL